MGSNYLNGIFTLVFAIAIFAAGFDIVYGYTGQINLGPVFAYGIAGFTTAFLDINTPWPIWVTFALGPIMAVITGLVLAGPSLRLSPDYFSLVTWMIALIANQVFLIQTGEEGLTNGVRQLFGGAIVPNYYLALILLAVSCGFLLWIGNSKIGITFKAIREDQRVAEAIGINTTLYKLLAFAISNFFIGVAGSFVTTYLGHVDYNFFAYNSLSWQIIAMTIVGGAGTVIGPVMGAFLLYTPLSLFLGSGFYSLLVYATIIVVAVLFFRRGLLPSF